MYQRYQARVLLRWYTRLPKVMRRQIDRLLRALPEPMVHHSSSARKKAYLFLEIARKSEDLTHYVAPLLLSRADLRKIAPTLSERGHNPPGIAKSTSIDDIQQMMAMDALVYLPQDILRKVDRATMAYSLEARSPFLDTSLVEFAFSIPRHWHRRGISGKRMLREAFGELLPSSIWQRRKQGFAVPVGKWMNGSLGEQFRDMLRDTPPPLQYSGVNAMLDSHQRGRKDYSVQLWAVYIYLVWRRNTLP